MQGSTLISNGRIFQKNAKYPRARVPVRFSTQPTTRRIRAGDGFVPLPARTDRPRSPRTPFRSSSHSHVLSSAMWRGMDVVKLPRGHRPLFSPVPSATGHGHCPLVYPRGIRRTTREDKSRALWVNTHARVDVVVRVVRPPIAAQGVIVSRLLSCREKYEKLMLK